MIIRNLIYISIPSYPPFFINRSILKPDNIKISPPVKKGKNISIDNEVIAELPGTLLIINFLFTQKAPNYKIKTVKILSFHGFTYLIISDNIYYFSHLILKRFTPGTILIL